jgi:hypothetical protein
MPELPIRSILILELRGKEVSFTAKVLAAVGDGWIADISKQVEGVGSNGRQELKLKAKDQRKRGVTG